MKKNRWRLDYESQTYSQHGEDGIIKVLTDAIRHPNRFVFEIGWGSGDQNMSRNLFEQGWSGIGIDKDRQPHPDIVIPEQFEYRCLYVRPDELATAFAGVPKDMDFFSLDIDSFDFEIASWVLHNGYRPRTVCLEFNQQFGPDVQASFPWVPMHPGRPKRVHDKIQLYGVSLAKYQKLWTEFGYRFFTVDSSFVNAFFYDPTEVNISPNMPVLDNKHLPAQTDRVRVAIEEHNFWAQKVNDIYQAL
jgi:hypothetical protein